MISCIINHISNDKKSRGERVDISMLSNPSSACLDEFYESDNEVTSPSRTDEPFSKNDEVNKFPANVPPHIVGGIIHRMLLSDAQHYYPYDIQSALARTSAPMEKLMDEDGHSILHNIVIAVKPEFLSLVFYLGKWGVLRDQKVRLNTHGEKKLVHCNFSIVVIKYIYSA